MKKLSIKIVAVAASIPLLSTFQVSASCSETAYVGSICMTASTFCPVNYLEADGRTLDIADHQVLFAVISNQFGGDGRTDFALPDMRGRSAVGIGKGPALNQTVAMGQQRGSEEQVLTVANLPKHSHKVNVTESAIQIDLEVSADRADLFEAADGAYLGVPFARVYDGEHPVTMYRSTISQPVELGGLDAFINPTEFKVESVGEDQPVSTLPPQIGLRYCIAYRGYFPPRP